MRPTPLLGAILALALPVLAACANPSHEKEADELRDRLADLAGVTSVDLDYTEPITLDSGKLQLRVEMAPDADAADVREVVAMTYDAFEDVHHDEEGDLDVTLGEGLIHLRSFEPEAATEDVADAAERAVPVLASGTVRVDINTQDVSDAPHVHTQYDVTVPEPGAESLLGALDELASEHADIPDAGWTVRAGDEEGWGLSAQDGFPDQAQRDRLDQLREGLPEGATIWLGDDDNLNVHLPAASTPAEVSAIVGRHLALVGGPGEAYYDVQQGEELIASFIQGDCYFENGAAAARLEQDLAQGCTNVTRPDSP